MYLIRGIQHGNLLFFSRVNPDIPTGGFFSEEKWPIYQMLPQQCIPNTVLIQPHCTNDEIADLFKNSGLEFPVLVKPNIGERGIGIKIIDTQNAMLEYHREIQYQYLIQEFVPFPEEMSILAYKMPNTDDVNITSICIKKKLNVLGDGKSTLRTLATNNYRSQLQWDRLRHNFDENYIPRKGEIIVLEPIGNHARGTTFYNGKHIYSKALESRISQIFNGIDGQIYYGRFDILYSNVNGFIDGREFSVVEFNGVGSEPAHIYHPGYSIFSAYRDMWQHVSILFRIAQQQKHRGVAAMTWKEFRRALKIHKDQMRLVNTA